MPWAGGLSLGVAAPRRKGEGQLGRGPVLPRGEMMYLEQQRKEIKTKRTRSIGVPTKLRSDESEKKILAGVQTVASVMTVNKSVNLESVTSQR